jgi:hypothetical protein
MKILTTWSLLGMLALSASCEAFRPFRPIDPSIDGQLTDEHRLVLREFLSNYDGPFLATSK